MVHRFAYAFVALLDQFGVHGTGGSLDIFSAVGGEGLRSGLAFSLLFWLLAFGVLPRLLLLLLLLFLSILLFIIPSLGSITVRGRIRRPAESIGASIAILWVAG
jgi:hypothetical protein